MKTTKARIFTVFVSAIFLIQVYLLYSRPWWGAESQFPMTLLRSPTIPVVCGLTAILAMLSAKTATQRNILYSIIAASVAQIVTIEVMMLWLHQLTLVILSLILNAFITFQFLQYGSILLAEPKIIRREMPADRPTAKGLATVTGMVLRLTILAIAIMLGSYFLVGPAVFSEFGAVTLGVIMLPIIIGLILQQYKLRKNNAPASVR